MTPLRADPDLPLPEGEGSGPPRIGIASAGLALAAMADARPFLVEAGMVALVGTERGAVERVRIGDRVVAADVTASVGPAVNVVAAPGSLRRERLGGLGSVVETLLAAPSLPLAAVQWGAARPAASDASIEVGFTLAPGASEPRYRAGPTGLSALDPARPDEPVTATLHPPPAEWLVDEAPGGGVRVRATVPWGGWVTLTFAGGTADRVRTALLGRAHLDAQERRLVADESERGVSVRCGVGELDDAVAWAQERLASALGRPGPASPERIFWSGLGALAVGDGESAAKALSLLEADDAAPSRAGASETEADLPRDALSLLVASRIALTLGDAGPAIRHADSLTPDRVHTIREGSGANVWALWALSLDMLADALRYHASEAEIGGMRRAAGLPPPVRPKGRALPMAGSPDRASSGGWAERLRLLLHRGDPTPFRSGDGGVSPFVTAWSLMAGGDSARGYALWRARLSQGLAGGWGPLGTWEEPDGSTLSGAPEAGALLGAFAHGLVGLFPDAPAGRVEVLPAFPEHVRRFEVARLPAGETRFTLGYRRDADRFTYTATPTRGKVPTNLVLAPTLPGSRVVSARVDGAPADLEWRPAGSGVRIEVQMPLDRERTLEVEVR